MKQFGLIGQRLGHSFSPAIHHMLGDYEYELYPMEPEALARFLQTTTLDGFNVTIPYKNAVIPACERLTDRAKAIGSVNTMTRLPSGGWLGDNTDYDGFLALLGKDAEALRGKKALVLGSGGASKTVCAVLHDCGIVPVVISRTGENNYQNLPQHRDAELVVNATPVGMYPNNGRSPLDLQILPNCKLVLDLIYNPAKTALLLQAESLGIPARNGLIMLVAQAARSSERFCDTQIPDSEIARITGTIAAQTRNIILIGMPGCGKSTVARYLGERTGRAVVDIDREIVKVIGMDIPSYFAQFGEGAFRTVETQVLRAACAESGKIIATGGGVVTMPENRDLLRQNGVVLYLNCDKQRLSSKGRPVTQRDGIDALLEKRLPLYHAWCDAVYENTNSQSTAQKIQEDWSL